MTRSFLRGADRSGGVRPGSRTSAAACPDREGHNQHEVERQEGSGATTLSHHGAATGVPTNRMHPPDPEREDHASSKQAGLPAQGTHPAAFPPRHAENESACRSSGFQAGRRRANRTPVSPAAHHGGASAVEYPPGGRQRESRATLCAPGGAPRFPLRPLATRPTTTTGTCQLVCSKLPPPASPVNRQMHQRFVFSSYQSRI